MTLPHAEDAEPSELSFPRQQARTGRFSRGVPRSPAVAADGSRVAFLRSASGTDPTASLWVLDVAAGVERLVADARELLGGDDEELSADERARRERSREGGSGIVGYATDRAGAVAAFALSGRLFVADLTAAGANAADPTTADGLAAADSAAANDVATADSAAANDHETVDAALPAAGATRELPGVNPVADPRPSPDGGRVAYVAGGALRVIDVDGSGDRALVEPDGPEVTWGLAEFIAAEEMERYRGFWWAPDSSRLLVARVDESPVQRWWVADPAHPDREPAVHAYPAAGTPNADVRLAVVTLDGGRVDVEWDRVAYEYVVTAGWHGDRAFAVVQSRDQRTTRLLRIDPASGVTELDVEDTDPYWVEIVTGVPGWTQDRRVTVADRDGWRRLLLDGSPVTPVGLQVRAVRSVDDAGVLFTASSEPADIHLWHCTADAVLTQITEGHGVHGGLAAGGTLVVTAAGLDRPGMQTEVRRAPWIRPAEYAAAAETTERVPPRAITSYAQRPVLRPRVELLRVTDAEIPVALILPRDYDPASGPLPVLMDPYGGPHAQRVLAASDAYLASQWFAEQGFAVVVVDGAGTPGRGYDVERAVAGDFSAPVLGDQVAALQALAALRPVLDLSRVGIRGWSFGGYLSAMAVLRRPDVFHAAVAGAPVIDQRLYDTHYTERYLGDPATSPTSYELSSLVDDAPKLERPLMLIHGLADDNVVVAHSLRMSSALLAAGRPHTVLPLSGVTHMTPQEEVAENLLLLQVEFLQNALR